MFYCRKKFGIILFLFAFIKAENYPKIGLVLSGGGSKGFAHIATLEALDSLNIPIDFIAGTSFGAIVGAMYALGYSGKQIKQMALDTDWYEVQNDEPERKYLPFFRKKDTGKYQLQFGLDGVKPVVPTGLIYGQKIILDLSKWTREYEQLYNFDKLPIPFRCNAFDIISGKEVILKEGSLSHALRASISIPTIFAPVEWGDGLLVDGGVINNLPVDIVKEMGADIVLAIDVSAASKNKSQLKNIYDIVDQTISVHGYERTKASIKQADYYIHPEIETVSFTDYQFNTIQYLFNRGKEAVLANWDIFVELKKLTSSRDQKTIILQSLTKPVIRQIIVNGNEFISKKFIRSFIGLKKGMKLNPKILDENIAELYSLGYFRIIYYEIHTIANDEVNLIINVQETQLRKFNVGLRWDNYYDLIATANIQLNTKWLPGIRIEDEIQFAGIQKNEFSLSYPSRRLNFPIYPYFSSTNLRYPVDLFSDEEYEGFYTYSSDEIRIGLGLLQKNYWNTEVEYFKRKAGIQNDEILGNPLQDIDNVNVYAGMRILAQLDLLDDVLLPKYGILLKGKYENSRTDIGSSRNYDLYQISGEVYKTYNLNTYGIMGYYHQTFNELPRYLTTLPYGSEVFAGMKEFQLHGSTLAFSRLEYRYKHKKDIFIRLMANWLITAKSENSDHTVENIWGFGMGITLLSPVGMGPFEFIWSWGPSNIYINKDWQSLFHFSAGYKF